MKKTYTDAFENVKNQIGYCGIWCGSCVVGNGTLRVMTEKYKELIENYGMQAWGPQDFDYNEFLKGLSSIKNMPLCAGCLRGDGRENCELKLCATQKGVDSCNVCPEIESCAYKEALKKMRSGALSARLFVCTDHAKRKHSIEQWTNELRDSKIGGFLFDE